jgi:lactate permease
VIAALATVGLVGKEGIVIRVNLLPVVGYTIVITLLLSVAVVFV